MATVDIISSKILTIEYWQEKTDEDYGSCLWARFLFDLDNYDLHITSDCGNYAYGWIPTPERESFLELMSRVNGDYLLEKISDSTVVDGDATFDNVKEFIMDILDGEEPDFDMEDIAGACYYQTVSSVYDALCDSIKNTDADYYMQDSFDLFDCIVTDYPANAKKIVQVFMDYIRPKLIEMVGESNA